MNCSKQPDSDAFLSVKLRISEVIGNSPLYFNYLVLRCLRNYGIRKCTLAHPGLEPGAPDVPRPVWKGAGGNGASPGANAT